MFRLPSLPPLSLYVHFPWCVRKCPYCDFNSHAARGAVPEREYMDALLRDLDAELSSVEGRRIETIFFGGGTPSLFSPESIAHLLDGVRARIAVAPNAEITLEANPGTVDTERFKGFRDAGVNRLSIGIQSFDDDKLKALGRIHGRDEALRAAEAARDAGFENFADGTEARAAGHDCMDAGGRATQGTVAEGRPGCGFNLDLMFGLPGQTVEQAVTDIRTAIELQPTHLSAYQLTLEPNTLFHARPPQLPDDDATWDMQQAIQTELTAAGFKQYEVSAYAKPDRECRHNLNYWRFGDYLGLGAGAHGKLTGAAGIMRHWKVRHPDEYLKTAAVGGVQILTPEDAAFEFMLNALRLREGFPAALFTERTGLSLARVEPPLREAEAKQLLERHNGAIRPTDTGRRLLNDLLCLFLPDRPRAQAVASPAAFIEGS